MLLKTNKRGKRYKFLDVKIRRPIRTLEPAPSSDDTIIKGVLYIIMKEIDNYAILNVPRDATAEEITLAYRKLAIKSHPHRDPNSDDHVLNPPEGIDEENHLPSLPLCAQWAYVNRAYDILSNPLRREIYDRFGEAGLLNGMVLPHGYFAPYSYHGDYFRTYKEVFGSYSPYATIIDAVTNPPPLYTKKRGIGIKERDKPIEKLLYLTLKEIFTGAVKRMKILRHEFIDEEKTKTEIREKILIVPIAPGTLPGTRIIFKEEGDQSPSRIPADIIFVTADKPHEVYYRSCSDLYMDHQIDLRKSLVGFRLLIQTIDERKISLSINEVMPPNAIKKIDGEGLPKPNEKEKGDLYIHFDVKFPTFVPREMKVKLARVMHEIFEYNRKEEEKDKKAIVITRKESEEEEENFYGT